VTGTTQNAARTQIIVDSVAHICTGLTKFFRGINIQAVLAFLSAVFNFVTAFVDAIRENMQQDSVDENNAAPPAYTPPAAAQPISQQPVA